MCRRCRRIGWRRCGSGLHKLQSLGRKCVSGFIGIPQSHFLSPSLSILTTLSVPNPIKLSDRMHTQVFPASHTPNASLILTSHSAHSYAVMQSKRHTYQLCAQRRLIDIVNHPAMASNCSQLNRCCLGKSQRPCYQCAPLHEVINEDERLAYRSTNKTIHFQQIAPFENVRKSSHKQQELA